MMRIPAIAVWLCLLNIGFACADEIPTLAVVADQKLSVPMAEIARMYAKEKHIAVSSAFFGPRDDAGLLMEGASTDVFITAHDDKIASLTQQGIVDIHSRQDIARNHLVLAGPANSPLKLSFAQGFPVAPLINAMQGEPLLVLGNPETLEEGSIAREVLKRMDVSADMEPYVIYIKQFGQIIRLVSTQNAYAMLYVSDVLRYPDLKLLGQLPDETHAPVLYHAVVLAGDRMGEAREFIRYLQDKHAQDTFKKYGIALE